MSMWYGLPASIRYFSGTWGMATQSQARLRAVRFGAVAALLALPLAACQTDGTLSFGPELGTPTSTLTVQEPDDVKYYPSDEPLHLANEQFSRGNYGLAERYYRDAVEKAPRDVTAWIGLAASYDHIGRFDLADRAYV